jgi:chorismate-pyruvate lyase
MSTVSCGGRRSRIRSGTTIGALLLLSACTGNLARFERTLAAQDSATAALGQWCGAMALATPPVVRAERIADEERPPPPTVRELLDVDGNQTVAYRHVRLSCGGTVLSVAHNWYVPSRIPPAMNEQLETTDTPFGKVVAPLQFTRERLASKHGAAEACPKDTVLSHRALLRLPDGRPLSFVVECYTRANLAR